MIAINKKSNISITQQIVQELEERIRSGLLRPLTKLPSIRALSKTISVSPMTVVAAYENLALKGLIFKIHGKGSFVADFESKQSHEGSHHPLNTTDHNFNWQDDFQDYATRSGYVQRVLTTRRFDLKNMAVAALHHRFLPTQAIFEAFSKELHNDYHTLYQYPPIEGDPMLIQEVIATLTSKAVARSTFLRTAAPLS